MRWPLDHNTRGGVMSAQAVGTTWDYKTVVLTGGYMGRHSDELRRARL
jgi:hypothetical protein